MSIQVLQIHSDSDLKIAFAIREKVFVNEQEVPLEEEFDEFEDTSIHYLTFYGDRPVGAARFRITGKGAKLERIAILQEYRGKGFGASLVKYLLAKCKIEGHSKVYLNAQQRAKEFYSKLGFRAIGEIFLEAGIEHIEMQYKEKKETKKN